MGTASIDILIERAKLLENGQAKQALLLLEDAMTMSQHMNYWNGIAAIHFERGIRFLGQSYYKKSLTSFHEALHGFTELNDKTGMLNSLHEISSLYYKLGDCPSALNHILESLKINQESGDQAGVASNHNELGKLYVYLQDYTNAIEHFKNALRIFEGLKDKKELVNSYFLIGNAYNWTDDYDKALYYLLRGVNAIERIDDVNTKAKIIGSLAIVYTKQKEYDKALTYFNDALKIANTGASPTIKAQLQKSLGNLYIELTQFDKAIDVLKNALKIAEVSPAESQLGKIHEFLSHAYEKLNDQENALLHFKKFVEIDKEITSEEVNLKTKALYIKYDLEELKKQKEIAELSDKMKEQFLANVSHEIRTPMNGVLGMAHLLNKTNPTPEQEEYIEAIKLSANNLMAIINDILDFSKINAGKIEFSKQEFSLRELLKGVVQILQSRADEKKIQIGCTIDYRLPENMVGDPIRLNQILINLMGNAVKFTEKGKVTLDARMVETTDKQCRLKFTVTDSGIGIPEDKLNSIFESFEQVDNSKKRYEGTGLGLTIVKHLIELQGGNIRVKSRVSEGSEFTFELEFTLPESQPKSIDERHVLEIVPQDFSHITVLIVEDNKINQLLVKNMLKKFGFSNFDCAENGKTAFQKLDEKDFGLILMDIQMPEMDGYEITKVIRSKMRDSVCNIPIIALTADASDREKEKAKEAGMNDYVVKPYTPEELYSTMLRYIADKKENSGSGIKKKAAIQPEIPLVEARKPGMALGFLEKFTGGDIGLTVQLIELCLNDLPQATDKLENLIPQKNWKEVHAVAHKVKSCISIFELKELKEIILRIEEYARDLVKVELIPELFIKFKNATGTVILDLKEELRKLKQAPTR